LMDLALPYLSKIAIDRYILSSWHPVYLRPAAKISVQDFIKGYGHLMETSEDGSYGLISHHDMQEIDPADLHRYRREGLIAEKRFYKISPEVSLQSVGLDAGRVTFKMRDGAKVVPIELLDELGPAEILRIRSLDIKGIGMVTSRWPILILDDALSMVDTRTVLWDMLK
ncbi:hypothetical protein ACFL9T_22270, partial [Thermodesulfobacteriota bacterium]